jgi:Na+/proline symporter
MPVLAGLVGILTVARFGPDTGLAGYRNLTTFAAEISPVMGGITLAAVLAAVISSGGPILLSSATMFVRDWVPAARDYSSERRLRAYRAVTVVFALVSALIAWWIAMSTRVSILDLLLFAFAMVLPAAIVVAFVLYWRRTTERGAYWGMLAGYVAGVVWFVAAKWALWVGLEAPEGATGLVRLLVTLLTGQGEGLDPAYVTTVVPLVTVPIVSLLTEISPEREAEFRARLVAVPDAG